jgi:hypothetical protein
MHEANIPQLGFCGADECTLDNPTVAQNKTECTSRTDDTEHSCWTDRAYVRPCHLLISCVCPMLPMSDGHPDCSSVSLSSWVLLVSLINPDLDRRSTAAQDALHVQTLYQRIQACWPNIECETYPSNRSGTDHPGVCSFCLCSSCYSSARMLLCMLHSLPSRCSAISPEPTQFVLLAAQSTQPWLGMLACNAANLVQF